MAKEIERKFLVVDDSYRCAASEINEIRQGYVSLRPEGVVRVRTYNNKAYITVKGINSGCVRNEWEYPIPLADAIEMLQTEGLIQGTVVEKVRYVVDFKGHKWEVDEFKGRHTGLVVAEIELTDAAEPFEMPSFVGEEVTGNVRYYNSSLSAEG